MPTPPLAITGTPTASRPPGSARGRSPSLVPSRSIDVSRISPAPSASASPGPRHRVDAGRRAAAVGGDLPARARRGAAAGRRWPRPRTGRRTRRPARPISSGRSTAAVLTPTLSAPARSRRRASSTERMPPPTVNGMNTSSATRRDDVDHRVAGVGRRGDVEEHQLVGALGVVAGGELDGVAGVAQADEVDALDHPPGVDVEARDHADATHRAVLRGGQGLTHAERTLVQRPAHDRPGEPAAAGLQAGERPQVGERADAAGGDDVERGRLQHRGQTGRASGRPACRPARSR